jgi:hypothetical protein
MKSDVYGELIGVMEERLPVKLTEEDVKRFAEECAALDGERELAQEVLDRAKAKAKSEVERVDTEIAHRLRCIRERQEVRPVEVAQYRDLMTNKMTYVRNDSREVVRDRTLRADERQANLPGIE